MKPVTMIGSIVVTLALLSYSIAIFTEQKSRQISNRVLLFLSLGVVLDISATICMIVGTSQSGLTLHGLLGYSSLAAMLLDTILIWRFHRAHSQLTRVPLDLHLYSRFAYIWWVIAYVTGGLLVAMR
jgi:hypothetical protein